MTAAGAMLDAAGWLAPLLLLAAAGAAGAPALRRWRFDQRAKRAAGMEVSQVYAVGVAAGRGAAALVGPATWSRRLDARAAARLLRLDRPGAAARVAVGAALGLLAARQLDASAASSLLAALVAGLAAPAFAERLRRAREAARVVRQVPDVLSLMIRSLRAGGTVNAAVAEVGRQCADPLGGAFRRVDEAVRLGRGLEAALKDQLAPFNLRALNFLVVAVQVQREAGGNLTETLENLDLIVRRRLQTEEKARAMASEARASAWILGSLPFVIGGLVAWMSPDYLAPLFGTTAGHLLLGAAGASLSVGVFIMSRLARLKA